MPSVTQKLAAANARVAALEARITVATEVYRNQRARIAELDSQVAAGPIAATTWQYARRDGSVWQAARNGNRVTSWQCPQAE